LNEEILNEKEALVVLSSIPYLGPVRIRLLLKTFGSALNVLKTDPQQIEEMQGFGNKISEGFKVWQNNNKWKETLEISKKYGIEIISFTDSKYPEDLLRIDDSPLLLYVLGDLKKEDRLSVSVVGTRQASIYGLEMAERISQDLAEKGLTVISGLARGIDTAAHIGALKRGRTIAVIGSGLRNIYPKENWKLAEDIAKNGAVISEFAPQTAPERQNFPRRNRIVSGMSLGTLLIEAPHKSGAMITMEMAHAQHKKLFAIPGRLDSPSFAGNHLLLKNRHAELVANADDICKSLNLSVLEPVKTAKKKETLLLPKEEQALYNKLPEEEFSIEEIAQAQGTPVSKLNVLLMSLMLKRAVKEYPGKIYKKINV